MEAVADVIGFGIDDPEIDSTLSFSADKVFARKISDECHNFPMQTRY